MNFTGLNIDQINKSKYTFLANHRLIANTLYARLLVAALLMYYNLCFEKIGGWIAKCHEYHDLCNKNTGVRLPTHGVHEEECQARVVEINGDIGKYLTLSHCWDPNTVSIKLTKATLRAVKIGLSPGKLSKTFRDAMSLTLRLGLKYIWIDLLCILQNDKEDWELEAAGIAQIYRNPLATLCATKSVKGEGGLFSDKWLE